MQPTIITKQVIGGPYVAIIIYTYKSLPKKNIFYQSVRSLWASGWDFLGLGFDIATIMVVLVSRLDI